MKGVSDREQYGDLRDSNIANSLATGEIKTKIEFDPQLVNYQRPRRIKGNFVEGKVE